MAQRNEPKQIEPPPIDPIEWMKGQMLITARELERRFPGANITLFVSEPGAAIAHKTPGHKPQYNHATTAERADLEAVLIDFLAERVQQ